MMLAKTPLPSANRCSMNERDFIFCNVAVKKGFPMNTNPAIRVSELNKKTRLGSLSIGRKVQISKNLSTGKALLLYSDPKLTNSKCLGVCTNRRDSIGTIALDADGDHSVRKRLSTNVGLVCLAHA